VLFTGEEQGLLGSAAYAHAHRSELDQMVAAVIFDSGIGKVSGFALAGRKDIEAPLREMLQPVASLGVKDFTFDAAADTDNFDFMLEGVPTLVANNEPANYMLNYHAASDTFDKVDMAALKQESAIAAVTAFALADAPDRLGPRQSRSEVQQLLNQTGITKWMEDTGFLPYWEHGDRGREP
jgi:Zn-dependent M28 family amino/carboxypeptidase